MEIERLHSTGTSNHLDMDDFTFDKLPSTSQSTPKPKRQSSQMDPDEGLGSGTDHDSTGESSSIVLDETHSQQTNSKIDDISKRVEVLVGQINDSRAMDQTIMDNSQEKLAKTVAEICQQMKEHMYTVYEENSLAMQAKLQELSEVLESCSKLNTELRSVSQALARLSRGLTETPEPR